MSTPVLIDGTELIFGACVRQVPGKRKVLQGSWRGEDVFIKLFLHPQSALRHWQREVKGINLFNEAEILTPILRWSGILPESFSNTKTYAVITKSIPNSRSFAEIWQSSDDKVKLADMIMQTMASHHLAGLVQKDLHFGNFLVADNLIYSLDGDALIKYSAPLPINIAVRQIALLISQAAVSQQNIFFDCLKNYCQILKYDCEAFRQELCRLLPAERKFRCKKLLEKIYRNCTAVKVKKSSGKRVYLNSAFDSEEMEKLIDNPDNYFFDDKQLWLKNGNSSSVVIATVNGQKFVIKRYNYHKNFRTFLRRFKESRASISWKNAFRLINYGLSTPTPVALIEIYSGVMIKRAYFISSLVEGTDLMSLAKLGKNSSDWHKIEQKMGDIFDIFRQCGIVHGDCKATNFILSEENIYIIDLDAMKELPVGEKFFKKHQKDLERWQKN